MNDESITPLRVQTFVKEAKQGERLTYFVGNLAAEKARGGDRNLAAVARAAYEAAEAGHCILLQRRYGHPSEGNVVYLIEKRGGL